MQEALNKRVHTLSHIIFCPVFVSVWEVRRGLSFHLVPHEEVSMEILGTAFPEFARAWGMRVFPKVQMWGELILTQENHLHVVSWLQQEKGRK